MMDWGTELWDREKKVGSHVTKRVNTLLDTYAKYFSDKADVEKEYAKGLRRLVHSYEEKILRNESFKEEGSSECLAFRFILRFT